MGGGVEILRDKLGMDIAPKKTERIPFLFGSFVEVRVANIVITCLDDE